MDDNCPLGMVLVKNQYVPIVTNGGYVFWGAKGFVFLNKINIWDNGSFHWIIATAVKGNYMIAERGNNTLII